jgi:hypothetical protein
MNAEACKYEIKDVDKIVQFKTWSTRKKTDMLFHMDSTMYCNLGIDSTSREKKVVRTQSRLIYRAIKTMDEALGKLLLDSMDR